jgi:hypothetical protein
MKPAMQDAKDRIVVASKRRACRRHYVVVGLVVEIVSLK